MQNSHHSIVRSTRCPRELTINQEQLTRVVMQLGIVMAKKAHVIAGQLRGDLDLIKGS
jgi:hypothetical protein